jgi:PhzF family phenazine biosynthesis protein
MAISEPMTSAEWGSAGISAAIHGVDAFADAPFCGNPAAVCILDGPAAVSWMQSVAAEMNLSETAFLYPVEGGWSLRWFTPVVEVDLCGHATLASAHVLWVTGRLGGADPAIFHTRVSGVLTCVQEGAWISMDFPACPTRGDSGPAGLLEALGCRAMEVGLAGQDVLVEVSDPEVVRGLRPDLARLAALPMRGVIVTARATEGGYDFVSRFFAPGVGIHEDPVTGSAHGALAPYWGERLGKTEMRGWQASARGGEVRVRWKGDRVALIGQAVMVWRGVLGR